MKTGKRIAALLCAVLLLTFLLACCSLAVAEEGTKLDWADFATAEEAAQGEFQTIEMPDMPSVMLWIPSDMISVDTSFMEGPFKPLALYGAEDQSRSVILFVSEISSLDEYTALMETEGGGSNFRHLVINGVESILYDVEKDGLESLIYPLSDHVILSVNLMPATGDDNWEAIKNIILASIQPKE